MAEPLLADKLWSLIEPLRPPPKPWTIAGCSRAPVRAHACGAGTSAVPTFTWSS